ncbi:uroporphyrinogen-III synthase [Hyphomonas jannaschiana]|nr:uroporphyrinogen-III synthase [Hyphomonas jannaschiana]
MRTITLLTRPAGQESALLNCLATRGFHVENAPVLQIEQISFNAHSLQTAGIICITSQNGAHCLAATRELPRDKPIMAVGPGSAVRLYAAGFTNVLVAQGTGTSLVDLIQKTYPKSRQLFIHLSGEHVALDIAQALKEKGYTAGRVIGYRANPVGSLTCNIRDLIGSGMMNAAVFLSQRTASEFLKNVDCYGLTSHAQRAEAFVMSPKIAEVLSQNGWDKVNISSTPSAEAVVACLERHARRLDLKI